MGQLDTTTTPTIRDQICAELKAAEAADPNGVKAQTLRLVKCAMSDRDVSARGRGECSGCEDEELLDLLQTMVAQRTVSAQQFDEAGRVFDAERERDEIEIIQAYLPRRLDGEALKLAVTQVVHDLEASKLRDVGRCMSALRERFPGQIDCSLAGKAVRAALS